MRILRYELFDVQVRSHSIVYLYKIFFVLGHNSKYTLCNVPGQKAFLAMLFTLHTFLFPAFNNQDNIPYLLPLGYVIEREHGKPWICLRTKNA